MKNLEFWLEKNQIRIVLVLVIKQTNYKCLGVQVPHTNGTRNWVLSYFLKDYGSGFENQTCVSSPVSNS